MKDNLVLTLTFTCRDGSVTINNGLSFGRDLIDADDRFIDIASTTSKLTELTEGYKRIFCSVFCTKELEFLLPVIDDRWVIGGPISSTARIFGFDVPCELVEDSFAHYLGYDSADYIIYFKDLLRVFRNKVTIIANIGDGTCQYKCKFCNFKRYGKKLKPLDRSGIIKLISEINNIEHNDLCVDMCTNSISTQQFKWVLDTDCEHELMFYATPTKSMIETLRSQENTNNRIITEIGLESVTPSGLRLLGKPFTLDDVLEYLVQAKRLGIRVGVLLMNHQFNTTAEDVEESFRFLDEMERILEPEDINDFVSNGDCITRWPIEQEQYLRSVTDFQVNRNEDEFFSFLTVDIPESSDVYRFNKKIQKRLENSPLYVFEDINTDRNIETLYNV